MSETLTVVLGIAGFAIGFPILWCSVVWLLAKLGGWATLAARFATKRPARGETFAWSSGRFSMFSSYNNCLNVSVSHEGIHIVPFIAFTIGHEPLLIPWSSVRRLIQRRFLWNYSNGIHIDLGGHNHVITLYGRRLSEGLAKYAPAHLVSQ